MPVSPCLPVLLQPCLPTSYYLYYIPSHGCRPSYSCIYYLQWDTCAIPLFCTCSSLLLYLPFAILPHQGHCLPWCLGAACIAACVANACDVPPAWFADAASRETGKDAQQMAAGVDGQ